MRRLTAIMCMAISRNTPQGEQSLSEQIQAIINRYSGELLKKTNVEYISSFDDPVNALNCAFKIQKSIDETPNSGIAIGVHIGDLITENQNNYYGSGVDGARMVCQHAALGHVSISRRVFDSQRLQQELKDRPELHVEQIEEARSGQNSYLYPIYALALSGKASLKHKDIANHTSVLNKASSILLAAFLIILVGYGVWWLINSNMSNKSDPEPSVAVLPFVDFSQEGNQEWFSDGLTEEILNSLVRLEGLYVPARTSSFVFKNKNIPIEQIADSLNVNHIVEGSVRRSNGHMRIAVQLIEAKSGGHLWSKTYQRSTDSVFTVQKDIAENIATTLNVYLDEEKRHKMFAFGTRKVKAYEAFLKGEQILHQVREETDLRSHRMSKENPYKLLWRANEWYDRAIQLDSTFALPYHQRTYAYFHVYRDELSSPGDTLSKRQAYELIHSDFNKSIRYSNNQGNRLIYRFNKSYFSKDWSLIPDLAQKIHQNPEAFRSFVLTGGGSAPEGFIGTGYADLATRLYSEKLKKDPLNDFYKFLDVEALVSLGKAKLALDKHNEYLKTTPILRTGVLVHAGHLDKAKQILANMNPNNSSYGSMLYKILLGMEKLSLEELESLEEKYASTLMMKFYSSAGHQDKADSLAQKIDQSPLFTCDILAPSYGNVINFSIDVTSNFAQCLEQANLKTKPYHFGKIELRRIVQKKL